MVSDPPKRSPRDAKTIMSEELPAPLPQDGTAPRRPFWKLDRELTGRLLTLAYPVVLAMLTQTAINLLDTIMVGHLPKQYSIAGQSAIGYSLILLWSVGGFLSAFVVGTQAITARMGVPEELVPARSTIFVTFVAHPF